MNKHSQTKHLFQCFGLYCIFKQPRVSIRPKKNCLLDLVRPTVLSGPTVIFFPFFFSRYFFIKILNFSPENCWNKQQSIMHVRITNWQFHIPLPAGLPNSISRPCGSCKNLYNTTNLCIGHAVPVARWRMLISPRRDKERI